MQLPAEFQSLHRNFTYYFEGKGFVKFEGRLEGTVPSRVGEISIRITFPDGYPFRPPITEILNQPFEPTWHQNLDNTLCLYSENSPGRFPWLEHGAYYKKVISWIDNAIEGWPNEQAVDLDLERYFRKNTDYDLLVYPDLSNIHWLRLQRLNNNGRALKGRPAPQPPKKRGRATPRRSNKKSHQIGLYAFVANVGELNLPPRNLTNIQELLDHERREALVSLAYGDFLLLKYSRLGHDGVVALRLQEHGLLTSVPSASDSAATLSLRGGLWRPRLREMSVCILGVGAVGSYVAKSLAESGVGELTLMDHDILRPGNLIRHAATEKQVGFPKSEAMQKILSETTSTRCVARNEALQAPQQANQLISEHDLVVDATANEVVSYLLNTAAIKNDRQMISTYLANEGKIRVVQVLPGPYLELPEWSDEEFAPPESGCGEPTSLTPLASVKEVAAMATRISLDILLDRVATSEVRT